MTDALVSALQSATLDTASQSTQDGAENTQTTPQSSQPRPMRVYTRAQLLHLHRSPLVQPPPNMPELKVWFGCVYTSATLLRG